MYTTAIYEINKGTCALGCGDIVITDLAGTNVKYNGNGKAGGYVKLEFYNDKTGDLTTQGHVKVYMTADPHGDTDYFNTIDDVR